MTGYQEYMRSQYAKYIGAMVRYNGLLYKVIDVDYNGMLLIDIPSDHAETTAVNLNQITEVIYE